MKGHLTFVEDGIVWFGSCMHARMFVCMHVRMFVYMHVRMFVCMHVRCSCVCM